MTRWYRSRTVGFNLGVVAAAIWFDRSAFYVNPLLFVLVCAAGNLALRAVTTTGLSFGRDQGH